MRLIDADEIKKVFGIGGDEISCKNCKYLGRYGCIKEIPINDVCCFIDDAPTVDAVSVVRCKNCRFYLQSNEKCEIVDTRLRFYETDKKWTGDCFCSWGERRDEDDH